MTRRLTQILFGIGAGLILFGVCQFADSTRAEQGVRSRQTSSAVPGRPPMPRITRPVMFNTPEADRILAALPVFPPDNPWNEGISERPLLANSDDLVASVGTDKRLAYNLDMAFILVPPDQPRVAVKLAGYAEESDPGPYPVPETAPIEEWPLNGKSLQDIQRRGQGDRHMIVVDPTNGKLFEFYSARRTDSGWTAMQASIFDLTSNRLRPRGWTSTDAAGLPIFPAVVRFDELERGMVEHAMRFTVRNSRREYVYPATHYASRKTDRNLPRMGERFRLRRHFDVSGFSPHAQAILKGLKKYGMFVADNGGDWRISVAPDARIKGLDDLRKVRGKDFEVIEPTGPNPRPRAKRG